MTSERNDNDLSKEWNYDFIAPKILEESRKEEWQTENGFSVRVINIGDPERDIQVDPKKSGELFELLDLRRIQNEPISLVFDHRSYPEILKDAVTGLIKGDDDSSGTWAILRSLGQMAGAYGADHMVYIHTQDLAFFETIKVRSFDKILREELRHLTQDKMDKKEQFLKLASMLIEVATPAFVVLGDKVAKTIISYQENLNNSTKNLEYAGILLLSLALPILGNRKLYSSLKSEKDADSFKNVGLELKVADYKPKLFTGEVLKKIFKGLGY